MVAEFVCKWHKNFFYSQQVCNKCFKLISYPSDITKAKRYVTISKVTPELLRAFIERIEVHEKAVKRSRTCGNHIVTYFTFHPDKSFRLDGEMNELGMTKFA